MRLRWQEITNFVFRVQVQILMRSSLYNHESVKSLALGIYNRYVKSEVLDQAIQTYLDVCFTIDSAKTQAIGRQASTYKSNLLMQAVASLFALDVHDDKTQQRVSEWSALAEIGDDSITWFHAKLESLKGFMIYASQAEALSSSMTVDPRFGEWGKKIVDKSMSDADKQATDIFRELARLRKYGVKTSFFQDGMLHGSSQAWAFMDFAEIEGMLQGWEEFIPQPQLAIVTLSEKNDLTQGIGIETSEFRVGESHMRGGKILQPSVVAMSIGMNGELDASFGLGFIPVKPFFEKRGNLPFYHLLRLAQAVRLYDLVVPLTTVEKMPEPPVAKGMMDKIKNVLLKKHLLHPNLLIPRLRSLENVDTLIHDLEIEIEKAEKDTTERSKHSMSRHEVIYHVRRLPKNKKATAQARERAEKVNITLAPNETFVKKHERGEGELKIAPHRARTRVK